MAPTKLAASRGGINDPTYDPPTTGTPCTTPWVPQCVDDFQMCRMALTVTAGPWRGILGPQLSSLEVAGASKTPHMTHTSPFPPVLSCSDAWMICVSLCPLRCVVGRWRCRQRSLPVLMWHPTTPTKLAASRGGINDPTYDPRNPRHTGGYPRGAPTTWVGVPSDV